MFDVELPPVQVGRFVLERQIGAGGMGTVWAAADEALGRTVALKFLRDAGPEQRERVYDEARALAKVSHPHVIPIFEVGVDSQRVWLVMEWIPGRTLRELAEADGLDRGELLRCWLDAGQGLAAVHAAGLIHRDLKPENVLVGEDGRARLIDFGLVESPSRGRDAEHSTLDSRESVTRSAPERGFAGTRAYAAPEQLACAGLDARADQFSFALCVCEALTGTRARTPGELSALEGLTRAQRRALGRALSERPEERYAKLEDLLTGLEPPRWRRPVFASVGMGLVGAALALALAPERAAEPSPCLDVDRAIDELWSEDAARRLQAALPGDASRTSEGVDAWVSRWRASARQSCEDSLVTQTRSPLTHDRRMACLERRAGALGALLGLEREQLADSGVVPRLLAELDEPGDCLVEHVAEARVEPPPPSLAAELSARREQLILARTSIQPLSQGLAQAEAIEAWADERERPQLAGEAAYTQAVLERRGGRSKQAHAAAGRALDHARAIGDIELEAKAWRANFGATQALDFDLDRAAWVLERHAATVERMGEAPRQRAMLLAERGVLAHLRDDLDASVELLERADAAYAKLGVATVWERADVLHELGNVLARANRPAEARARHELARDLELRLGAPAEQPLPLRADTQFNLAMSELELGKLEASRSELERAAAAYVLEQGPRGQGVCRTQLALGLLADQLGDLERARAHFERASAIAVTSHGSMSLDRADLLSATGTLAFRQGQHEQAIADFERVLTIRTLREPQASVNLALSRSNLAEALHAGGRTLEAAQLLNQAIPVLERELGSEHPDLAYPLGAQAAVQLGLGDAEAALRTGERGLAVFGAQDAGPDKAALAWVCARAAAMLGRAEAAELHARRALELYRALDNEARVRSIEGWLAAPSKPAPTSSDPAPKLAPSTTE